MNALRPRLLAYLRDHQVLSLAVCDAARRPHAAALFYAVDPQLRLYVVSDPQTVHGQALASGQPVAGTIQGDHQQWHQIQGIQFHGPCVALTGLARRRGWALYTTRYPFLLSQPLLSAALAKTALWRIEPDWMRLIDNRLGFGHKEEWRRHRRQKLGSEIEGQSHVQ